MCMCVLCVYIKTCVVMYVCVVFVHLRHVWSCMCVLCLYIKTCVVMYVCVVCVH